MVIRGVCDENRVAADSSVLLCSLWVAEGAHLLPRATESAVGQDALHSTGHSGMQPVSQSLLVCSLQEFMAQLK